jgi:hypothetical protein
MVEPLSPLSRVLLTITVVPHEVSEWLVLVQVAPGETRLQREGLRTLSRGSQYGRDIVSRMSMGREAVARNVRSTHTP